MLMANKRSFSVSGKRTFGVLVLFCMLVYCSCSDSGAQTDDDDEFESKNAPAFAVVEDDEKVMQISAELSRPTERARKIFVFGNLLYLTETKPTITHYAVKLQGGTQHKIPYDVHLPGVPEILQQQGAELEFEARINLVWGQSQEAGRRSIWASWYDGDTMLQQIETSIWYEPTSIIEDVYGLLRGLPALQSQEYSQVLPPPPAFEPLRDCLLPKTDVRPLVLHRVAVNEGRVQVFLPETGDIPEPVLNANHPSVEFVRASPATVQRETNGNGQGRACHSMGFLLSDIESGHLKNFAHFSVEIVANIHKLATSLGADNGTWPGALVITDTGQNGLPTQKEWPQYWSMLGAVTGLGKEQGYGLTSLGDIEGGTCFETLMVVFGVVGIDKTRMDQWPSAVRSPPCIDLAVSLRDVVLRHHGLLVQPQISNDYSKDSGHVPSNIHVITRGRSWWRDFLNEEEIVKGWNDNDEMAAHTNMTLTTLGNLPLAQQMELVNRDSILVGIHGAGLGGVMFAQPGSTVVDLCPCRECDFFFVTFWAIQAIRLGACYLPHQVPRDQLEIPQIYLDKMDGGGSTQEDDARDLRVKRDSHVRIQPDEFANVISAALHASATGRCEPLDDESEDLDRIYHGDNVNRDIGTGTDTDTTASATSAEL